MALNELLTKHCRVVLVRPSIAGNIGATARVMRNFGLRDLRLVAPVADVNDRQARQLSTHGEAILDEARFASGLRSALADCVFVVGTSARTGGRFREDNVRTARETMPLTWNALANGPVALVFGPEQTGLSNEEVTLCHHLVHVATNPEYPALNLAQAVAIVLYELSQAAQSAGEAPPRPIAAHADLLRTFDELERSLAAIGYLRGDNAEALMHALRQLLGRAHPSPMEANLLLGVARQLRWVARRATETGQAQDDG